MCCKRILRIHLIFPFILRAITLQFSRFSQIAVLEAKEIKNSIQSDSRDILLCCCLHTWLGMECNTQPCLGKHGEVVGTIPNGNSLCQIHFFNLSQQLQ